MTESNRTEYKRQLTDNLEKEVVAFLNYHDGGVIYLGINSDGNAVGLKNCDAVQLAVKDRLKNNGYSAPRNKELMRVFRDLEIVERLGSGVPRILEHYDRCVFQIYPNFLRVVFPYTNAIEYPVGAQSEAPVEHTVAGKTSGKTSGKILGMMQKNDKVTIPEIAEMLCKTTRSIEMQINKLKSEGLLCRIGPAKGGHWKVLDE